MAWTNLVTRATGYIVTATNWNEVVNDFKAIGDAWTSYTPTFAGSTSFSLGNGTRSGYYMRTDKWVQGYAILDWGSTTSLSGVLTVTTPTSAVRAQPAGVANFYDTSLNNRQSGSATFVAGTLDRLNVIGSIVSVNQANPFTWATGDRCELFFHFEAA